MTICPCGNETTNDVYCSRPCVGKYTPNIPAMAKNSARNRRRSQATALEDPLLAERAIGYRQGYQVARWRYSPVQVLQRLRVSVAAALLRASASASAPERSADRPPAPPEGT